MSNVGDRVTWTVSRERRLPAVVFATDRPSRRGRIGILIRDPKSGEVVERWVYPQTLRRDP